MNIRKKIYQKYNKSNDYLRDIVTEMMREYSIESEDMAELIKSDSKLLLIYKTECEHLGLTKKDKQEISLSDLF